MEIKMNKELLQALLYDIRTETDLEKIHELIMSYKTCSEFEPQNLLFKLKEKNLKLTDEKLTAEYELFDLEEDDEYELQTVEEITRTTLD